MIEVEMKNRNSAPDCNTKWIKRLSLPVMTIGILCVLLLVSGCSSSNTGNAMTSEGVAQDDGAVMPKETGADSAGILAWSGFKNGKKEFKTAGCTEDPTEKELVYMAPFQGKKLSRGGYPGPELDIAFRQDGSIMVNFTTDTRDDSADSKFVRHVASDDKGVRLKKNTDNYIVTLKHFKIPNMDWQNQNFIFLDGVITCTKFVNG